MIEIRELIDKLNYYTKLYDEGNPAISDEEWDKMYFELKELEKETGLIYPDSPTQIVSYDVVNSLKKVEHNHKMLSLDKTKDIDEVQRFLGNKEFVAMAKMDGLTCSLRYVNGKLVSAETRGNGLVGEDVTHNALIISSIPKYINLQQELIVDGEIICLKSDFEQFKQDYKNPRNFAAGSIRLLNAAECALRKLTFVAWDAIKGIDNNNFSAKLQALNDLGFIVVPWIKENVSYAIGDIQDICAKEEYPIDGIVFKFEDVSYGESLGETAHHKNNAIAYKFYDEEYETRLFDIEWSMGRTGILTPIAVFEPVDDGDSIIEKASLHNLNIMQEVLGNSPYQGQKIWVCKQNAIIPQVVRANKDLPDCPIEVFIIPDTCPICGQPTAINESEQLYCTNPDCEGKFLNKIDHFCGKKGLDIKGLSKATLNKLIDKGWINSFRDIFLLKEHAADWKQLPGFGTKSVEKILSAIEAARHTTLAAFISAIGIPLIGRTVAEDIVKNGVTSFEDLINKSKEHFNFSTFNGFGPEKTAAIWAYDFSAAEEVIVFLDFCSEKKSVAQPGEGKLAGLSICVTGSLTKFKNREEIKEFIERNGGRFVTTISAKTSCLINNNINSSSSKNVSAKKYGIPIFTEEQFISNYSLIF